MDESLSSLYGVDTVDADHEIDLDYVLEHDTDDAREKFIRVSVSFICRSCSICHSPDVKC